MILNQNHFQNDLTFRENKLDFFYGDLDKNDFKSFFLFKNDFIFFNIPT